MADEGAPWTWKIGSWYRWVRNNTLAYFQTDAAPDKGPRDPPRDPPPPPLLCIKVEWVAAAARALLQAGGALEQLRETLADCSSVGQAINLRDAKGYNLLQRAIMCERADVVEYLVGQGADINSPICGRPLHLAASLGCCDVLRVLLRLGADPHVLAAVCYPQPHPAGRMAYDGHQWSWACPRDVPPPTSCSQQFFSPLHFAIVSDSVEAVLLLLPSGGEERPLHVAVAAGAHRCVARFISEEWAGEVNRVDGQGRRPVHYSLPHGRLLLQLLLQHGASLGVKTTLEEETLLHLLFQEEVDFPGMRAMCEYLLTCGLSLTINALTLHGDSALHCCLRRVHSAPPRSAADWQELEGCVRLLLQYKANPNIGSRRGHTALHELLKMAPVVAEPPPRLADLLSRSQAVEQLLVLLLDAQANPSIPCGHVSSSSSSYRTPLVTYLTDLCEKAYSGYLYLAACRLPPPEGTAYLAAFRRSAARTLQLLTRGRLDLPSPPQGVARPLGRVLGLLVEVPKWRGSNLGEGLTVADDLFTSIFTLLCCLLAAGVPPNHMTSDVSATFAGLFGVAPYEVVRDFMLVLLQYGADPNSCGYRSYGGVTAPDLDSLPLGRLMAAHSTPGGQEGGGQVVYYTPTECRRLAGLFVSTMEARLVRQCVRQHVWNEKQAGREPQAWVLELSAQAYTLRALSARAVRTAMGGKLLPRVDSLPLPKEMIRYLKQLQF